MFSRVRLQLQQPLLPLHRRLRPASLFAGLWFVLIGLQAYASGSVPLWLAAALVAAGQFAAWSFGPQAHERLARPRKTRGSLGAVFGPVEHDE